MHMEATAEKLKDRRFKKNHLAIKEAYTELLKDREPKKISVKDICIRADVNRSTFYQHYGYLEQLELDIIRDRVDGICAVAENPVANIAFSGLSKEELRRSIHNYILNFIHDGVLQALIRSEGKNEYLDAIIEAQCRITAKGKGNPQKDCAIYFQNAGACSTIVHWLQSGMTTPMETLEEIVFRHLELTYDLYVEGN